MRRTPEQELLLMTREQVDALPFGLITLDPQGTIVGYNRAESELSGLQPQRVLGRNFFQEVAPCTAVKEFAGLYGEMVKAGKTQSWEFSFVFRFAGGDRRVHIQLAYFPEHERGMILVQP